jgi:hypothetical protein
MISFYFFWNCPYKYACTSEHISEIKQKKTNQNDRKVCMPDIFHLSGGDFLFERAALKKSKGT